MPSEIGRHQLRLLRLALQQDRKRILQSFSPKSFGCFRL